MTDAVAPGGTVGILGGGQLGRMLAIAAAQLGLKAHIYAPEADPPAGDVAAAVTRGAVEEARRLLRETLEQSPEEARQAMLRSVPIYREIREAYRAWRDGRSEPTAPYPPAFRMRRAELEAALEDQPDDPHALAAGLHNALADAASLKDCCEVKKALLICPR